MPGIDRDARAPEGLSGALLLAWQAFEQPREQPRESAGAAPDDALQAAHRALGEWPPRLAACREHVLRHGVSHLLAAGDLKEASLLGLSADYLTAQCREIGVDGALASLQIGADRAATEASGKMDVAAWRAVAEAVRAQQERLSRCPLALPALVFERLRAAKWTPERISTVLSLPIGTPRIRRLHAPVQEGPSQGAAPVEMRGCGVSADGKRAVFGASDGYIEVRDTESGEVLFRALAHERGVLDCDISPDGLTVVSSGEDFLVRAWDLPASAPIGAISPRVLYEPSARLADTDSAAPAASQPAVDMLPPTPDFDAELKEMLAATGGVAPPELLAAIEQAKAVAASAAVPGPEETDDVWKVRRLRILSDGKSVLLGSRLTPDSPSIEQRLLTDPKDATPPFVWSDPSSDDGLEAETAFPDPLQAALPPGVDLNNPDAALAAMDELAAKEIDRIRSQDSATAEMQRQADEKSAEMKAIAEQIQEKAASTTEDSQTKAAAIQELSARQEKLHAEYSALMDAVIKSWEASATPNSLTDTSLDVQAAALLALPTEGESPTRPLAPFASGAGSLVVVARKEQLLSVSTSYSLRSPEDPAPPPFGGHAARITALAVTRDDQQAISGAADGTLRFWDLHLRKQIGSLDGPPEAVSNLAVTPDGKRVVACSGGALRLWDLASSTCLETYPLAAEIRCVATSGGRIVAGDAAGTAWVFDVAEPPPAGKGRVLTTGPVRRRHALVVGVRAYQDKALSTLPYCVNDARDLGRVLEQRSYRVTSLHDEQAASHGKPTRQNIRDQLAMMRLDQNDMLVVHFSCHGVRLADNRAYLFAADSVAARAEETAIAVDEIIARMTATGARRLVLMLDACYSGIALPGRGGPPPTMSSGLLDALPKVGDETGTLQTGAPATGTQATGRLTDDVPAAAKPSTPEDPAVLREAHDLAEGFAMFAASTAAEMSRDRSTRENGLFSSLVIDGLDGKADLHGRGFVSVADLNAYVLSRAVPLARTERGVLQTPNLQVQGKGDMVLVQLR